MYDPCMKICTKCNLEKPLSEFYKRSGKYGPKEHSYCKECHRVYCKRKRYTGEYLYGRNSLQWFLDLKANPCVDCSIQYPHFVMQWDHIPERGPKIEIVKLIKRGAPQQEVLDELVKCDLVCSNCHKIRTYARIKDSQQKELLSLGAL